MTNSKQQPDFDPHFWAELIEALPPALPLLEVLTTIGRSLQLGKSTTSEPSPYTASAKNQLSQDVCVQFREILQGAAKSEEKGEKLFDPYSKSLKVIERIRRQDIFHAFEKYEEKFSEKQWQVIDLYYRKELSQEQIAEKLGIGRSAVSNRLKRVRDKKDILDKDRRREAYEELRKQIKDDM